MECDTFSFSALTLSVCCQEGHPACKNLGVGDDLTAAWHTVILSFNITLNGDILVLSYPDCLEKCSLMFNECRCRCNQ